MGYMTVLYVLSGTNPIPHSPLLPHHGHTNIFAGLGEHQQLSISLPVFLPPFVSPSLLPQKNMFLNKNFISVSAIYHHLGEDVTDPIIKTDNLHLSCCYFLHSLPLLFLCNFKLQECKTFECFTFYYFISRV